MKHIVYLIVVTVLILPFSSGIVLSQNPQTISLQQAVSLALENNYQITRSQARLESENARVTASYGTFLPNLNVSASYRHSDIQGIRYIAGEPVVGFGAVTTTYSTGLGTSVTLFDGLSNVSRLNQSRYNQASAQYTHENTRRFVVTRVYNLYFEVFRRKELLRVSEENLRRSKAQLERIVESNRVGAVPIVDVYRQQVQVGNDELALIQAEQNLANTKAELTFYLGLNPVQEFEYDPAGIPTAVDPEEITETLERYRDLDMLTEQTLRRRADIEAVQQQLYAAESGLTGARGSYWPTVSLNANYGYTGNELRAIDDSRSFNYQLVFSIPLFQRFQRNNEVQQAKVQLKQAEIEYEEMRNQGRLDIRKAVLDLEASAKRVDVSEQNIVAAREEQRLAEERYNLGAGTLLDLIIANTNLAQAESNRIDAIFGFYLSVHQLEYLIGEELY
jgi:outer membrane protein